RSPRSSARRRRSPARRASPPCSTPRRASLPPDSQPVQLGRAQGDAALRAVDGERGREGGAAGGALAAEPAAALGARVRKRLRRLLEPAESGAAADAERRPLPEDLAPLLAQPVRGLAHGPKRTRPMRGGICAAGSVGTVDAARWRLRAKPSRLAR